MYVPFVIYAQKDTSIQLPDLQKLIDLSIANSPMVKSLDKQVEFDQLEFKSARSQWLSYVSIISDYRYGNFDYFNTESSLGNVQSVNSEELRYSVGLRLNISLYDFLGRERRTKKARIVVDQSVHARENYLRELKGLVAEQYYRVQFNLDIFKNRVELQQLKEVQKQIAERDYNSGKIDINALTDVLESYLRITEELQSARSQLETSYFLLEQIVGVSLNSINN